MVTGSAWGSPFGVPLALWGLVGYFVVFALSLLARQSAEWAAHAIALIAALTMVFVAVDVVLLGLMAFVIRYFCALCLATYGVNIALLLVATRGLSAPWSEIPLRVGKALAALVPSAQRPAAWFFWGLLLISVSSAAGLHAATLFVSRGTLGSVQQQIREFAARQPRVTVDVAGDPTMGDGRTITLVEFSDFLCPVCQRASKLNKIILANHRGKARLVFKQFPLDMSCNDRMTRVVHPGACRVAAAAECAHLQGKFWPFHDLVFAASSPYDVSRLDRDVRQLGLDAARFHACMTSGEGLVAVKRDIADASQANVMSTPTYVVNGVPVPGVITPAMFEDLSAVLSEPARR
jgi:protein-disulfide isomerase